MLHTNTSNTNASQNTVTYGLHLIEQQFDFDTFVYLLKRINRIIKNSIHRKESQSLLERRLELFDQNCGLNGLLSNIPIDLLIEQLGDAELIYHV